MGQLVDEMFFSRVKLVYEELPLFVDIRCGDHALLHERVLFCSIREVLDGFDPSSLLFLIFCIVHVEHVSDLVLVQLEIRVMELVNQLVAIERICQQRKHLVALEDATVVDVFG